MDIYTVEKSSLPGDAGSVGGGPMGKRHDMASSRLLCPAREAEREEVEEGVWAGQ